MGTAVGGAAVVGVAGGRGVFVGNTITWGEGDGVVGDGARADSVGLATASGKGVAPAASVGGSVDTTALPPGTAPSAMRVGVGDGRSRKVDDRQT